MFPELNGTLCELTIGRKSQLKPTLKQSDKLSIGLEVSRNPDRLGPCG